MGGSWCMCGHASTCQGSGEKEAMSTKKSRWMMVGGREHEAMRGGEDVGLKVEYDSSDSHWKGTRRLRVLCVVRRRSNYHYMPTPCQNLNFHATEPGPEWNLVRRPTGSRNRAWLKSHPRHHQQLTGRTRGLCSHPAGASYVSC